MERKDLIFKELSEVGQSKLALQLKDILEHIDFTRDGILAWCNEVRDHENRMGVLEKQVEAKAEELHGIERLIEENLKAVESGKDHLCSLQLLIKEHEEELAVKEKEYSDSQRRVGAKERECELIEKRVQLETSRLNWYEKSVEEKSKLVESKERELIGVERMFEEYSEGVESKERELNKITGSIEKKNKIFALIEEKVKEAQSSVDECNKETELRKEELRSIQKSIVECSKKIESKEKVIRAMDEKVKFFSLHKKSVEDWSHKLELRETQFELKVEQLSVIEKRMNECISEVLSKENHLLEKLIGECKKQLDSQENTLRECSNGLEMKEKQLEQQAKELELKQKQIDSIRKSTKEDIPILESTPASMVSVPSSSSSGFSMNTDGRGLQLLMNEHLKKIDLFIGEMSAHLKASSDPAKLVLDAMQGFYPSNSAVDGMKSNLDLKVIRRSCVLLLQELKRFSPRINSQVREEARKLAADWKAKMTVAAENSLQILGFLWLLTAFDLTSSYNERELQYLVAIVAQSEHANELCQGLGNTDKAPGSTVSFPVKIEEAESTPVGVIEASPSPNLQLSATTDSSNSQGLSVNNSVEKEMFDALRLSHDPQKIVLNVMQTSLDRYWRTADVGFKAKLVKLYIPMLKELMTVSGHVRPDVKKDANSLAVQWKAKMRAVTENSLEILVFVQFIATYGLVSTLGGDEIVKLLGIICQHKQALELCQKVGIADMIPDFFQNLTERKQLIEAVRFISTFKLRDKFPIVRVLKEYVEGARKSYLITRLETESQDEKDEAANNQIADLRAVIQCIKDYNLESEYPSEDIELQIVQLEKHKENLRHLQRCNASKFEQQEQENRKKRSTSTSAPNFEPPEKRQNKSHLTTAAAASRPYGLPTFNRGYSQLSSSSRVYEDYGHPGQFRMAANNHENGVNLGANAMQLSSSSRVYADYGHPGQYGMAANNHETGVNLGANAMQLSSSSQLYGNYRGHGQFGMQASYHEAGTIIGANQFHTPATNHGIGANFSAIQNAGLHNSNPFFPGPHRYGTN